MKKSITTIGKIVLLLLLFNANLFSQNTYIIKAGLNMSNMDLSINSKSANDLNKLKAGVHFGFFFEKPVNKTLSLESGLMFDQKGLKRITETDSLTQTDIINLYSLNIPVNLKIGYNLNNDTRLFGKLGGYGGYNFFGKIQTEIINSGLIQSNVTKDLNIGNDKTQDDFKPIDFGAQVGLGITFKKFLIEVMYEKGLANIIATKNFFDTIKNENFKFSIGYQFGD